MLPRKTAKQERKHEHRILEFSKKLKNICDGNFSINSPKTAMNRILRHLLLTLLFPTLCPVHTISLLLGPHTRNPPQVACTPQRVSHVFGNNVHCFLTLRLRGGSNTTDPTASTQSHSGSQAEVPTSFEGFPTLRANNGEALAVPSLCMSCGATGCTRILPTTIPRSDVRHARSSPFNP